MVEALVGALAGLVGFIGTLISTSIKIGAERQARVELATRHGELAKELREQTTEAKTALHTLSQQLVDAEKTGLMLSQRLDAIQAQLVSAVAVETERLGHIKQQVDLKASIEMVTSLEKRITSMDSKLDELLSREPAPSSPKPRAVRRRS